jgi:hypothetical protein
MEIGRSIFGVLVPILFIGAFIHSSRTKYIDLPIYGGIERRFLTKPLSAFSVVFSVGIVTPIANLRSLAI